MKGYRMSSTDKPALHQGSLSATKIYTGSDAPNTSGDTASPPNGSLYVRRDPTGAAPQGEVGVYEYAPSYTPTGLSAVPAGWRPLAGGEVINVKRFGATGNGTTDDYPAIASAIAAARKTGSFGTGAEGAIVFFPPGVYRITKPLDCTLGQFTLQGSGRIQSVIRGDTGAGHAIVELVGARFCALRDLLLDTVGMQTPSTVGVLMARTDLNGFAEFASNISIDNVVINLHSSATANGGNGTVGLYNYCCEITDYQNVMSIADTGAVYTSNNLFSLNSVHRPIGTTRGMFNGSSSMTVCTMTGANWLGGIRGPALRLNGCANIKVDAYLSNLWEEHQSEGVTGPSTYAINVTAQLTDFEYHGSMEGFPRLLRNESFISGMRLHAYSSWSETDPRIYLDRIPGEVSHATIRDSVIDVVPTPDSLVVPPGGSTFPAQGYLIDSTTEMASRVLGSLLWLRYGKVRIQNTWANSELQGNVVISLNDLANVVFSAPTKKANLIHAYDKTEASGVVLDGKLANGVRLDAGKLGVGNAASATTISAPGTVVKKIEVFDASGTSLGFVPVYASIT